MSSVSAASGENNRLGEIRASAQGWHKVQLASLGFIGLCGVLQGSGAGNPRWLEITAGMLVLLALVLSCLAIGMVAAIAWPFSDAGDATDLSHARSRLRAGIILTFVALAVLALGTSSSWWPRENPAVGQVEVTTASGSLCGQLRQGEPGVLVLDVGDRRLLLALEDVIGVRPVDFCE